MQTPDQARSKADKACGTSAGLRQWLGVMFGGPTRWKIAVAFGGILLPFLIITSAAARYKDQIAVSCYLKDTYMDTVAVFDPESAARTCNVVYYDCDGNCSGCFRDEDSLQVCIDKWGQWFRR